MSAKATNREAANREAFERLCAAEPVLVNVKPAIDALPGMTRNAVLTSGAPLLWDDYYGGQRDALIAIVAFSKEAPKSLLAPLERARGVIYERTPDVETGALSLAITDEIQGALTQAEGAGGLAMVSPEDESQMA